MGDDLLKPGDSQAAIVVVGPTASGKSELAQCIAERIGGAVLSADSMQVYRGMNIGTGKVTIEERRVPHFGLDLVDPGEPYSASLFQEYGRQVKRDLDDKDMPCVVCGGTGFYIRALIDDYRFPEGEQVGNTTRDKYAALLNEIGPEALWQRLHDIDPHSAALLHHNDTKRVIRAFELIAEGTSYAKQHEGLSSIAQLLPAVFIGLDVTPAILNERIDARVDAMVDQGLVDEVSGLLNKGFRSGITAQQAIGYKEMVDYLDGRLSLDDALDRIKTATHRYAKRQRTWFRRDKRIQWLDADSSETQRMLEKSLQLIATMD